MQRREAFVRAASLAIAAAVFVLVVSQGHAATALPADVEVVEERCFHGDVIELTLEVDYRGEVPVTVTPHVWSEHQHVQFAWSPQEIRLEPGTQTVAISAPEERAVINGIGARGQIYLADGQRRAITNWGVGRCT